MTEERHIRGGVVPVFAAAVLWGTVGPAQVIADTSVSPTALGACRMLLGGAVLAAFTVRRAGLRTLLRPAARWWTLASVLVTAAFQVCFMEAIDRTGAALTTAVSMGAVPAITGLWSHRLDSDRASPAWWAGTALSVTGLALLFLPGQAAHADPLGLLLALVAGASFATYITATKQLGRCGADTATAAPASVLTAGVIVSPWLVLHPTGLGQFRSLVLVAWLALATTGLAYWLFARGSARISSAQAGTLSLAEPLVATGLGVTLLGEGLTLVTGAGAGLLLSGLIVTSLPPRGRVRSPQPGGGTEGPAAPAQTPATTEAPR